MNRKVRKAIKSIVKEHDAAWSQRRVRAMVAWAVHSTTIVSVACLALYIVSLFFIPTNDRSETRIIVEAAIFLGMIILSFLIRLTMAWFDHTSSIAPIKLLLHNFKHADTINIEDITSQLSISFIKDIVRKTISRRLRQYRHDHPSPLDRILILVHDHVVFGIIASLSLSIIAAAIRISVLPGPVRSQWVWLFFERQIYVVLPLLEFISPLMFFLATSLQDARVLALFQTQQLTHTKARETDWNPWSPGGREDSSNAGSRSRSDSSSSSSSSSSLSSTQSSSSSSSLSSTSFGSTMSSSDSQFQKYSIPVNSLGDLESGKRTTAQLTIPRRLANGSLVRDYLFRIFKSDISLGALPVNSVADILANVTTLACVDQRPVREPHPFAEKVLLLGRHSSHSRSGSHAMISSASKQHLQDASEAAAHNAIFTYDQMPKLHRGATAFPVILHLQRKTTMELEFIDAGWRTYLAMLKPLGLNCMLAGAYSDAQHDIDLSEFEEGLRKLAKAIGFVDAITDNYEFVLELRYDVSHRTRRRANSFNLKCSRTSITTKETAHNNISSALSTVTEALEPDSTVVSDSETPSIRPPSAEAAPSAPPAQTTTSTSKHDSTVSSSPNINDSAEPPKPQELNSEQQEHTPSRPLSGISTVTASSSDVSPNSAADNSTMQKSVSEQSSPTVEEKQAQRNSETVSTTPATEETKDDSQIDTTDTSQIEVIPTAGARPSVDANGSSGGVVRDMGERAKKQQLQEPIQSHPLSERATYLVIRNHQTSKLELMTTGDPLVVLSHCTQYWNGSEIKRLTKGDRRTIRQVLYHWSEHQTFLCVGHSYRPVPANYYNAVLAAGAQQQSLCVPGAPRSLKHSHSAATRQDRTKSVSSFDSEDWVDLEEIKNDQIWIGLVGLRHQPKPMAPLFVEQLDVSHIRFVYFSEENEQRSKVFADKLGLETGWNSFITLKDQNDGANDEGAAVDEQSIQKLPVGVSNVRDHLRDIDNVPLLVRLFVDATAENKAEMLKIAEENGEVVFCMGTVANSDNIKAFVQCPVSFGLLPAEYDAKNAVWDDDISSKASSPLSSSSADDFDDDSSTASHHRANRNHNTKKKRKTALATASMFLENERSTGSLVTDILRLACHFVSRKPQSFVDIVELLILGRRLEQQTLMFAWMFFFSFAALSVHQLLSSLLFVSMTLTGIQLYYIGFLIIPIQAFSLLWNPRPPGLGALISEKNTKKHRARIIRYSIYATIRTAPMVIVSLILFAWTLWYTWTPFESSATPNAPTKWHYIFGVTKGVSGFNPYQTKAFQDALSFSQNVSLFALVLYIVTYSVSCIHRTFSLTEVNPKHHRLWIAAAIVSLVLAIIYFIVSEHSRFTLFTHVHPYMYILLFGWIPCQIILDELVKRDMRAHFVRTQEILKLDYNTKLGMYSPI